ncbi:MAG: hypothetical protein AAF236_12375 [Verrucomicrobiota bacterium]
MMKNQEEAASERVVEIGDWSLGESELGFVQTDSLALVLLGIRQWPGPEIRIRGKAWGERSLRERERLRHQIGCVYNSSSDSEEWLANLDLDENVLLAGGFDRSIDPAQLRSEMGRLARQFGMKQGIPRRRAAVTEPADQIRSQWVRALLPSPKFLLIFENPLDGAPEESASDFIAEVKKRLGEGATVVWVEESRPDFAALGFEAVVDLR